MEATGGGLSEASQIPTELQSLHGCEDWSFSELRDAGDMQFEELQVLKN